LTPTAALQFAPAHANEHLQHQDTKNGMSVSSGVASACASSHGRRSAEPDLVGFAIEARAPGAKDFAPLLNRLAFSYTKPPTER